MYLFIYIHVHVFFILIPTLLVSLIVGLMISHHIAFFPYGITVFFTNELVIIFTRKTMARIERLG